jgi:hypothetical protein
VGAGTALDRELGADGDVGAVEQELDQVRPELLGPAALRRLSLADRICTAHSGLIGPWLWLACVASCAMRRCTQETASEFYSRIRFCIDLPGIREAHHRSHVPVHTDDQRRRRPG